MKIAFLILAHKNPDQLSLLLKKLQHPNCGIFLHLDKRNNLKGFTSEFDKNNLEISYISQSQKIIYSSITYIYATLDLLKKAYHSNFDYYILISGQDFPIKSINEIVDMFQKKSNMNYFDYTPFPFSEISYSGDTRIKFFNYEVMGQMETLYPWKEIKHEMSFKGKLLNAALWLRSFGKTQREFPMKMKAYYSSQWWNMSKDAIAYILDFVEKHPGYLRFHKHALHPEEMFFQSILLNAEEFNGKIENDNLRYIRWEKGNKHPEVITEEDLDAIKKSNAIFARKINSINMIEKLKQILV